MKGIMLVRNPVEKVWSNMRRAIPKRRGYSSPMEILDDEIKAFIHDSHQINSALFTRMISNWSQCLKSGNLFVGAFDDVSRRPEQLLLEILRFLGVKSKKQYLSPLVNQKIRVSAKRPLTDKWRKELEDIFSDELKRLNEQYGFDWSKSG